MRNPYRFESNLKADRDSKNAVFAVGALFVVAVFVISSLLSRNASRFGCIVSISIVCTAFLMLYILGFSLGRVIMNSWSSTVCYVCCAMLGVYASVWNLWFNEETVIVDGINISASAGVFGMLFVNFFIIELPKSWIAKRKRLGD